MTRKLLLPVVLSAYALFGSALAQAEIAVIVHPSNAAAVSDDDIKGFYLGKQKAFADGKQALPLWLTEGDATRSQFNQAALGKSDSQLKAYWSKVLFTGKGTPPKEVTVDEMLELISTNPNTIGFVDASKVTDKVKVVAKY